MIDAFFNHEVAASQKDMDLRAMILLGVNLYSLMLRNSVQTRHDQSLTFFKASLTTQTLWKLF